MDCSNIDFIEKVEKNRNRLKRSIQKDKSLYWQEKEEQRLRAAHAARYYNSSKETQRKFREDVKNKKLSRWF